MLLGMTLLLTPDARSAERTSAPGKVTANSPNKVAEKAPNKAPPKTGGKAATKTAAKESASGAQSTAYTVDSRLAYASPDTEHPGYCVIIGPSKNPRWKNTPGIEQTDLSLFALVHERFGPMVSRYRNGAGRVGSPSDPRLLKSDECKFMDNMAKMMNSYYFSMPTMECKSSAFIYRLRPLGSGVEMDTIQLLDQEGRRRRVVAHEWVTLVDTGHQRNGCRIRITRDADEQSQRETFKMCLPGTTGGPGRVAMMFEGQNLSREAMQINCTAENGFDDATKDLVQTGVAPVPGPRSQPYYETTSSEPPPPQESSSFSLPSFLGGSSGESERGYSVY